MSGLTYDDMETFTGKLSIAWLSEESFVLGLIALEDHTPHAGIEALSDFLISLINLLRNVGGSADRFHLPILQQRANDCKRVAICVWMISSVLLIDPLACADRV